MIRKRQLVKKLLNIQKNILRLTRVHSRSGKQQRLFTLCYCLTFQTTGSRTTLRRSEMFQLVDLH